MLLRSGAGCARSARLPLKRPARAAACLVLAAFRLVRLRKRPWPKFPARSGFEEADRQIRCETLHLTEANNEPWNAIDDCTPWDACPCGISESGQARGNVQQRCRVPFQTRRRRTAGSAG